MRYLPDNLNYLLQILHEDLNQIVTIVAYFCDIWVTYNSFFDLTTLKGKALNWMEYREVVLVSLHQFPCERTSQKLYLYYVYVRTQVRTHSRTS